MARTAGKPQKKVAEKASEAPTAATTRSKAKAPPKTKEKSPIIKKAISKKPNKKEQYPSYKRGIYAVLKSTHNDISISSKAMSIMNSFVIDMFERIAREASVLTRYRNSNQMSEREIKSAMKLMIPGELLTHGISECEKALRKFKMSYQKKAQVESEDEGMDTEEGQEGQESQEEEMDESDDENQQTQVAGSEEAESEQGIQQSQVEGSESESEQEETQGNAQESQEEETESEEE